jgi:predicted dehydrogenase
MNVRFGILGCGVIADTHAEAIKNIKEATLVGVADNLPSPARAFAEKYSVKAYENYREMLLDEDVDAVCVCTPSGFHAQNAVEALRAGKHVVLEKPMAISTQEADEVIRVANETGRVLTVMSQLRFSEDVQRVKKLVEQNAFGKITLCTLSMKYYRPTEYYSASPWRGTLRLDGGGALLNQGIHGVDLLQYIVGDIKDVQGTVRTLLHPIEVEDTAGTIVEFANGAVGVIDASTCAYPGFARRLEIHGDTGYVVFRENRIEKLVLDGVEQDVSSCEAVDKLGKNVGMPSDMHKLQIENFIRAIDGKETLLIDGNEGKKAVSVIERIYQSSKKKERN